MLHFMTFYFFMLIFLKEIEILNIFLHCIEIKLKPNVLNNLVLQKYLILMNHLMLLF